MAKQSRYVGVDAIENIRGSILIDEFDGGLNTKHSNESLRDSEAIIRQNWSNDERGAITKVNGFTKANSSKTMGANPVRGLFRCYTSAGTRKLLAVCDGKLFYSDDDAAFTQEGNTTAITETEFNAFVNYNDKVFMTNATDNIIVYSPATDTAAAATDAPTDACKIILKRTDRRLIALNNDVNGSTLYYSKIDPTGAADNDWSATNDAGSMAIDGALSEKIVGGATFGSVDIVFKDYAAFQVWGYPTPQAIKLPGSPGCAAPYSVAQGDGLCFHLAHDGVYLYDGNKFILISDNIESIIDSISPAYAKNAFGIYRDGLYWLFYTASGDIVNKNCVVYDAIHSNSYVGQNLWYSRVGLEVNCPTVFQGPLDDNQLYAGGSASAGFVYRLDYSASGADDIANITSIYQTKYFDGGYSNMVKRFTKILVTFYLNTGSLTFNWYVNRGLTTGNYSGITGSTGTPLGSFILDTSTLGGILDTTSIALLDDTAIGKNISLKITNTAIGTAPVVRKIEVFWEGLYYE